MGFSSLLGLETALTMLKTHACEVSGVGALSRMRSVELTVDSYIEKRRTTALQVQELRKEWDCFEESLTLEQLFGPLYPAPSDASSSRAQPLSDGELGAMLEAHAQKKEGDAATRKRVHAEMEKKMDSGVRVNKALAAAYGVVHKA